MYRTGVLTGLTAPALKMTLHCFVAKGEPGGTSLPVNTLTCCWCQASTLHVWTWTRRARKYRGKLLQSTSCHKKDEQKKQKATRKTRTEPALLLCGINFHPYPPHNITTTSLSTVSTISSNYRPLLIDMNNNRGKLVNGEHNCPRQKAKHRKSHFTAGASRRRRLGCGRGEIFHCRYPSTNWITFH